MNDIKSYLPEFDDFLRFKRRYKNINKIKNTDYRLDFDVAEYHFIQYIYQYYLHHGVDFLKEQIDLKIDSISDRETFNYYIQKAVEYKEQYMLLLEMDLENIGELAYFDTFSRYYPINRYTLKEFVLKNKDIDNTRDFAKMISIALRLMVDPDNEESKYEQDKQLDKNIHDIIEILDYKQKHSFVINFKKDFIKFEKDNASIFNEIYPKTTATIKSLRIELKQDYLNQFPCDGNFDLQWNYVTFMNGYMFLYHPKYPEGGSNHLPLRHNDENSRKALNDIKGHIIKKLQPIKVIAEKNRIVAIQDINQISEAVEYLQMTTTNEQVKLSEKEKQQAKSNSIHDQDSSEVLEKLKLYKSKYLEYLSDINLVNHKVYYALEARVNSSKISTTEVAFIFTLKQDQEHTWIVYENNLPARVSACFVVKTERYNEAIEVINNFFSSDSINKREMLMSNSVEFDETCIIQYFRVNHDDFNMWKLAIKEMKVHQAIFGIIQF